MNDLRLLLVVSLVVGFWAAATKKGWGLGLVSLGFLGFAILRLQARDWWLGSCLGFWAVLFGAVWVLYVVKAKKR